MRNIHFKTCTCLLGILLMLFSGIQARGASLEVQQERKISGTVAVSYTHLARLWTGIVGAVAS